MSQVSMNSSLSFYMQDSEYLKIQAELDREKNRQFTENEENAANKNTAANQAVLEQQLKDREAELDLQKSLQLEEADKKEQKQKEVLEANRTQNERKDDRKGNDEASAAQSAQASSEVKGSETDSVTDSDGNEDVTEKADEKDNTKQQMNRFEMLQGHMRSLQSMNSLGEMFIQKISQTSGEIRTDSEDYNYSPYSKSITQKEAARGDLERRKESVDDRAGKTLRDTFKILKEDKTQDSKKRQNERMSKMQQNLSGLDYANTAFSHNVNFTF